MSIRILNCSLTEPGKWIPSNWDYILLDDSVTDRQRMQIHGRYARVATVVIESSTSLAESEKKGMVEHF